jgi:transcriptional regulator with XRE-family HTH domain
MKNICGDAIFKYISDNDLTIAEFSRFTGVHVSSISRYISGTRHPSLRSAIMINNCTEIPIVRLLGCDL